jgi:hypothetical protein
MSSFVVAHRTPTSKSQALDSKVLQFDGIWHLGIRPRDVDWTPSKDKDAKSEADQCFDKIKYLFWNAEQQLDNLLFTIFPRQADCLLASEHLSLLLRLLSELFLQVQNSKRKSAVMNQPFENKLSINEAARPRQSTPDINSDDEFQFTTPPESPTLAASQPHIFMRPDSSERIQKRQSDGGDNYSPPKLARKAQLKAWSRSLPSTHTSTSPVRPVQSYRRPSEHFKISNLPNQNLFVDETTEPPTAIQMSFKTRFECARVALASGLDIYDLASEDVLSMTTYDNLWAYFKQKSSEEPRLALPKRSSPKVWQDPSGQFLNLKASLAFDENPKSTKPLFKLQLHSMKYEKSCRFKRAFGGDRFLYLFLPDLKLPQWLKDQEAHLEIRLQEWLKSVKQFLGREWEVVHVEPVKPDTKKARKDRIFSYRVILFATSGYDILPRLEMTIDGLINWFMPLKKTGGQSFCKAYARLDLGLLS